MIEPTKEKIVSLADAAMAFPGGAVHISTLHRWRLRGVGGAKLETFKIGGKRFTSTEAIQRFIAELNSVGES